MANATATAEAAVASIRSQNPEMRLDGARKVRKLLSPCRRCAKETDPPVQEVLDAGLLDDLIGCLAAGNDTKLQFEAAWAITNIASSDQTYVVVDAGACPILIELLTSESHDVREQCIWCLGNVAGDRVAYRDELLNHATMMPALLQNFEYEMGQESPNMSLLRNATWLLSNLCRAKPVPALPSSSRRSHTSRSSSCPTTPTSSPTRAGRRHTSRTATTRASRASSARASSSASAS